MAFYDEMEIDANTVALLEETNNEEFDEEALIEEMEDVLASNEGE